MARVLCYTVDGSGSTGQSARSVVRTVERDGLMARVLCYTVDGSGSTGQLACSVVRTVERLD